MSGSGLNEAVEAAALAAFTNWAEVDATIGRERWADGRVGAYLAGADDWRAAITAALPHIEAAVREQIAWDIEAWKRMPFAGDERVARMVLDEAARIARGES